MTGRIPNEGRSLLQRRADGWMPRANSARGKVRGALPRTPARGTPPETPAPFPFTVRFQNGPRRPGYAPQNLFKTAKDFAPPRKDRAPWTAAGRSQDLSMRRERGPMQRQNRTQFATLYASRWSGPEMLFEDCIDKGRP
jgi:hypothetical protein